MRDDDGSLFLPQSEKNHTLVNPNYIKTQNYHNVTIMMEKYDIPSHNYETKAQNHVKPSQKVKLLCDNIDSFLIHEFTCPSSPDVKRMWLVVLNGGSAWAQFNAPLRYYLEGE